MLSARPGKNSVDNDLKQLLNLDLENKTDTELDLSLDLEVKQDQTSPGVPNPRNSPVKPSVPSSSVVTAQPEHSLDPVHSLKKSFPQLTSLPQGKEGLRQIEASPTVKHLDKKLELPLQDQPQGPAYRTQRQQISAQDRTPDYKQSVEHRYVTTLSEIEALFRRICSGEKLSNSLITDIVQYFMTLYIKDESIILNATHIGGDEEEYLYSHSLRVCLHSLCIASAAGFSKEQVIQVGEAGLLADIGMLGIPAEIRNKGTEYTGDDVYEIQKHPMMGLFMIERIIGIPDTVAYVAYQHHERNNGSGYPKNKRQHIIHSFSKIVAIADTYQTLLRKKAGIKNLHPYEAMVRVLSLTKEGLLDDVYVRAFLSCTSLFPVGSLICLSNKAVARVIQAHPTEFARPIVSVLIDTGNKILEEDRIYQVNLSENPDLKIAGLINENHYAFSIMHGF